MPRPPLEQCTESLHHLSAQSQPQNRPGLWANWRKMLFLFICCSVFGFFLVGFFWGLVLFFFFFPQLWCSWLSAAQLAGLDQWLLGKAKSGLCPFQQIQEWNTRISPALTAFLVGRRWESFWSGVFMVLKQRVVCHNPSDWGMVGTKRLGRATYLAQEDSDDVGCWEAGTEDKEDWHLWHTVPWLCFK